MTIDFTKPNNSDNQNAWSNNAGRLAKFVVANLINRDDAYGKYRALDNRDRGPAKTVQSGISESVIQDHFRAEDRGQLIGLHTTSPDNMCRWMVIDIDHHNESAADQEDANERASIEIYEELVDGGFKPLLFKSNGRGGFHIWIIFDSPAPTEHVHRFGNAVVADWKEYGLTKTPEVFPKQSSLDRLNFGNWVRLPGLHHTYDFYTEVWDGGKWLAGQAAIDQICDHELVPAELVESVEFALITDEVVPQAKPKANSGDERPIDLVVSKLHGVRRSGAGYVALCPYHHDSEPSLSINEGEDGRVLINCFADCEREEIVKAIGLEWKDLFAKSPDGTDRQLRHLHPTVETDNTSQLDLAALHQTALDKTTLEKIEELAISLGVSVNSLQELQIAWSEPDGCWLFPERDHQKRIIGLMKRFPDGSKRSISGGKRGLYIPTSFSVRKSEIIVVEGGSDTAAGLTLGWNVIGRPSASDGVSQLIPLLKSGTGRILVLGDNDPKRDGSWPGRRGAEQAAKRLGAALRTDVLVTSIPMEYKDLRSLVQAKGQGQ
jgi:hypothetical protein